ncbi:MAG: response regulator [Deltaproteobacteria bacterium]|nr:response regulator [Deltaproteobacteria bacterium]
MSSVLPQILVTDDSRIARASIVRQIDKARFTVLQASGGHEAIEIYEREKPAFVFMDLTMPKGDGYEALERILQLDKGAKVVVVTADIQPKAQLRCMALGALEVVKKPVPADVCERLLNAVGT